MYKRIAGLAIIASMLSACGGGSSSLPASGAGGGSNGKTTTVAFTLKVPGSSIQTKAGRKPLYVSRDTKGMGIVFQAHSGSGYAADSASCTSGSKCTADSSPNAGMAIAPGNGTCGAAASDGSYSCTVYIAGVPVGFDDFRFTLWNAAPTLCGSNGTGCKFTAAGDKAISVQVLNDYAILTGQGNTVPLSATFYPVVDSAVVSLSYATGSSVVNGTVSTMTANLTLRDANGDIILGGSDDLLDQYGNKVTLTMNVTNDAPDAPAGTCGANQGSSSGCTLAFSTPANPTFSNTSQLGTQTIDYDGKVALPAYAGTVTLAGAPAGNLTVTINGNPVTVTSGGVSNTADAASLASAINGNATDAALVYASSNGAVVTVVSAAGTALSLSASGTGTETATASGAALASLGTPQVTVTANNGGIGGANLPATVSITGSNSGSVSVPAVPQITGAQASVTGPSFLAYGSDGYPYAVSANGAATKIDQVNGTTVTAMTLPGAVLGTDTLGGLAAGSDSYLWFTDTTGTVVYRQAPCGNPCVSTLSTSGNSGPISGATLGAITAGPDGNMWLLDSAAAHLNLDKIAPNTMTTVTPVVTAITALNGTVLAAGKFAGGDQAVCYTTGATNSTVECWDITQANKTATDFVTTDATGVGAMAFGGDGLLYVATAGKHVYAINASGSGAAVSINNTVFTYPSSGTLNAPPAGIAYDAYDGSMWVTEGTGSLARIQIESTGNPPATAGVLTEYPLGEVDTAGGANLNQILANPTTGWLWSSDTGHGALDVIQTHT